jgi:hypothetical protein
VSAEADAEQVYESAGERRAWWLRVPAVLISPAPVFAALRDDSDEANSARQEQVLLLLLAGGVAGVLFSSVAGHMLDDPALDGVLVAVWAFLGGSIYGVTVFWLGGAALYAALHGFGSLGSYRRARHLLALAGAPLALALLTYWPVRAIVYGGDAFRSGGSDSGTGGTVFVWVGYAFMAWSVALLVVGVRAVHGWTWARAAAATATAALLPALIIVAAKL